MGFKQLLAGAAVVAVTTTGLAFTQNAEPVGESGIGRTETCRLDTNSGCVKEHGLGSKPTSVTVTHGGAGVIVSVSNITNQSYRVDFRRHDGAKYKVDTPVRYYAHYDFQPESGEPNEPPTSPPPNTDPEWCNNPWTTTATDGNGAATQFNDHDGSGEYEIHNNMWNNWTDNEGPAGTYKLSACDYDNWRLEVTQAENANNPSNAVRAYPNVHRNYNKKPLTEIESATFAHKAPLCNQCIYNVAFDVWINDAEGQAAFENELMIWTQNRGQTPAGNKLGVTTIGGKEYDVWKDGGNSTPGGIFTFVSKSPQTSGTMPLGLFFNYLESQNWIKKPAGHTGPNNTWQVDYGVEMVTTGGTKQSFEFINFSIKED
jgi:hypothetical protein